MGPPPLPISGGREIRGSQPDSPPPLASPFRTRFQLDSTTNGKIFTSLCNFISCSHRTRTNEGSYHSSGPKFHTAMPILEDGLSSGHASDLEDDVIYSR